MEAAGIGFCPFKPLAESPQNGDNNSSLRDVSRSVTNRGVHVPVSKGRAAPELVYHPDRLKYPLKRTHPKGDPTWAGSTSVGREAVHLHLLQVQVSPVKF